MARRVLNGSTEDLPPVWGVCRPLKAVVDGWSICHGSFRLVLGVANSDVLTALLGVSTAVMTLLSSSLKSSSACPRPNSSSNSTTAWLRFRLGPDDAVSTV